jgi:hypothetical protein
MSATLIWMLLALPAIILFGFGVANGDEFGRQSGLKDIGSPKPRI